MALLYDLYKFTKYVEDVNETDRVLRFNNYHDEAWTQYAEDTGITTKEAKLLGKIASDRGYITYEPLNGRDGPPNKLIVSSAGAELIHKTMFGRIPKGLWLAWADKNSTLINILWLFVGVIVGRIDDIIKIIVSLVP